MHDQPIQLDASFDTTPHYVISSWLRTIDSRVVSGEPIAIIDDGTTQRVITAPCTGRIVDIYTEVGARILPRTVLGMVRPDLVMPEINQGVGSIVAGIAMIALALIIIPLLANIRPINAVVRPNQNEPQPTTLTNEDSAIPDAPMPDAPLPGSAPDASSEQPATEETPPQEDIQTDTSILPMPNTSDQPPTPDLSNATAVPDESSSDTNTDNTIVEPTPEMTPPADTTGSNADEGATTPNNTTSEQDASTEPSTPQSTNDYIATQFNMGIDRIVVLTQEVQNTLPSGIVTQQDYDEIVRYAATDVQKIVDDLSVIVNKYRDYADLTEENRRWFTVFNDTQVSCLTIYATIQQSVSAKVAVPDLSANYEGCFSAYEYVRPLP